MALKILFYVIFALQSGLYAQQCCPDGWTHFHASCYFFADETTLNWTESAHYCSLHGATLVQIDNAAEDNFLVNQGQRLFRKTDSTHTLMNNSFWTGGTDDIMEGEWLWYIDNSQMTYKNWNAGQPDSTGGVNQDCLLLYAGSTFKWHDHECSEPAHPICEIILDEEFGPVIG